MKNFDDENADSAVYFQEKWEPGGYVREEMNIVNGIKRKRTVGEIASVFFGFLNIVIAKCVILLCVYALFDLDDALEYLIPWNRPSNDEVLGQVILTWLALAIMMTLTLIFLGMSIALIFGVVRKKPGTMKSFIVYSAIMLPVFVIINVFYFIMIALRNEYEMYVIHPQIGLLLFNVLFALELLTVYKAYKNMKTIASYNPTQLQEIETL